MVFLLTLILLAEYQLDSLPLGPFTNGPDFDQSIRDAFGDK